MRARRINSSATSLRSASNAPYLRQPRWGSTRLAANPSFIRKRLWNARHRRYGSLFHTLTSNKSRGRGCALVRRRRALAFAVLVQGGYRFTVASITWPCELFGEFPGIVHAQHSRHAQGCVQIGLALQVRTFERCRKACT
jgi:hypothetical protein